MTQPDDKRTTRPMWELYEALDSAGEPLTEGQKELIEAWTRGVDVNDMAKFDAPVEYADDEYNGVIRAGQRKGAHL
jgi:hypothetical protein